MAGKLSDMVRHLRGGSNPRMIPASFLKRVARILDGLTPVTRDAEDYAWHINAGSGGGGGYSHVAGACGWISTDIWGTASGGKQFARIKMSTTPPTITYESARPMVWGEDEVILDRDSNHPIISRLG